MGLQVKFGFLVLFVGVYLVCCSSWNNGLREAVVTCSFLF